MAYSIDHCKTNSDYATKVFGFATFGRIYGTVICVSGAGQLLQPALDVLAHGPLHDDPVPLNVFFAVAGSILSGALTLFVYVQTRGNRGQGQGQGQMAGKRRQEKNKKTTTTTVTTTTTGEVGTEEERRGLLSGEHEQRSQRVGEYGGA